jgi:hypothetical protein
VGVKVVVINVGTDDVQQWVDLSKDVTVNIKRPEIVDVDGGVRDEPLALGPPESTERPANRDT